MLVDSAPQTKNGTALFTAPEILINTTEGNVYDGKAIDIWSIGVVSEMCISQ